MLSLCSATICCSCHIQIPVHGLFKSISPYSRTFNVYTNNFEKAFLKNSNGVPLGKASFGRKYVSCSYHIGNIEQWGSVGTINPSLDQTGSDNFRELTLRPNVLTFVEDSLSSVGDDQTTDIISSVNDSVDIVQSYSDSEPVTSSMDVIIEPPQISQSVNVDLNPLSGEGQTFDAAISEMKESTFDTVNKVKYALDSSLDSFTSSVKIALKTTNEVFDNVINDVISFANKSGESAGNKLTGLSSGLKEKSGRVGLFALDALRGTIVIVEDSLVKGAKVAVYAYGYAKENLPPEFQEALSSSENSVSKVFNPIGAGLQQVYIGLEGFEERLGLDPNDPLVPIIIFFGVSATLWGSYRFIKYSGYSGDLSPQSTSELLRGNQDAVLIDIRPEDARERDGIPDLRRTARYRYASVTLPEVGGSVRKLLKGGRNVEDALLATVIRNLKIVNGGSKVIVMDVDGSRSKSVARSLRKLGVKRPYLVQGGFRSWVGEGCRIKGLKPETALTILNEEAEAIIIEEIKPTPLKLIGLGVGFAAAAYSLLEWETTLQFIGVIGLGLTIFWRAASYQDAEDLKQDVSLLLSPVKLGGQAISWASGKLEPGRNGLPTSPSSSDVQSRVLQAAAKHESQPSDTAEESQDSSQISSSTGENVNPV